MPHGDVFLKWRVVMAAAVVVETLNKGGVGERLGRALSLEARWASSEGKGGSEEPVQRNVFHAVFLTNWGSTIRH